MAKMPELSEITCSLVPVDVNDRALSEPKTAHFTVRPYPKGVMLRLVRWPKMEEWDIPAHSVVYGMRLEMDGKTHVQALSFYEPYGAAGTFLIDSLTTYVPDEKEK